jgi:hypothetical protein
LEITLTLTAHSYSRNPSEEVFTASAWTSTDSFDFSPSTPIVLYASVLKGMSPVLDADVKMFLEDSEGHVMKVDLFDDGFGMYSSSTFHRYRTFMTINIKPIDKYGRNICFATHLFNG